MRKKAILAIGALLAGAVALSACDCLNSVLTEHAIRTLADEMFAEAAERELETRLFGPLGFEKTGAAIVVLVNSSATGFTTQLFHAIAEILDSSRPAA